MSTTLTISKDNLLKISLCWRLVRCSWKAICFSSMVFQGTFLPHQCAAWPQFEGPRYPCCHQGLVSRAWRCSHGLGMVLNAAEQQEVPVFSNPHFIYPVTTVGTRIVFHLIQFPIGSLPVLENCNVSSVWIFTTTGFHLSHSLTIIIVTNNISLNNLNTVLTLNFLVIRDYTIRCKGYVRVDWDYLMDPTWDMEGFSN